MSERERIIRECLTAIDKDRLAAHEEISAPQLVCHVNSVYRRAYKAVEVLLDAENLEAPLK